MKRRGRGGERGVALPMALMMLMLLTTLMLAFSVLAQTEPVIAANHLRTAQARSLADSGFERAVWALTCGFNEFNTAGSCTNASRIAFPLPAPVPAPYDGTQFVSLTGGAVTLGGFVVTVVADPGGDPNVREITSVGWTPTNLGTDTHTKAHRKIQASVNVVPNLAINAPCAICVRGSLSVGGHTAINGTNTNTACGPNNKYGAFTKDGTSQSGNPTIVGGSGAAATGQDSTGASFDNFKFGPPSLNALKEAAKKNGTYYGPGYPNGTAASGTYDCKNIHFRSANKVNNGIVFVDTCDGSNPPVPTPTAQQSAVSAVMAAVQVDGNPFTGTPGTGPGSPTSSVAGEFTGWFIVNGSLQISGDMTLNGLVYSSNDFNYTGTGNGGIFGLAISQNAVDTSSTTIDSQTNGNSLINFDCAKASQPNVVPQGFQLVTGTYRELTGQ
jgi:hypothetical protein